MQCRMRFVVAKILLLSFSPLVIAKGELANQPDQHMIQQESIEDLMAFLTQTLVAYVENKAIASKKERLAWLLTMRSGLVVLRNTVTWMAWDVARATCGDAVNSAWHTANRSALYAAAEIVSQVFTIELSNGFSAVETTLQLADWSFAKNEAIEATRAAISASSEPAEIGAIAHQSAERCVIRHFSKHAFASLDTIYGEVLSRLGQRDDDPFGNESQWIEFYNQHFASLPANQIVFLAPWLIPLLPKHSGCWLGKLPPTHRALFMRLNPTFAWDAVRLLPLAQIDTGATLHLLLPEIIHYTVLLAVRALLLPAIY